MSFLVCLLLLHFIGIWISFSFITAYIILQKRKYADHVLPQKPSSLFIIFSIILGFSFCWEILLPLFICYNLKYWPIGCDTRRIK